MIDRFEIGQRILTDEDEALVGRNTRNNTVFIRPVRVKKDGKDIGDIEVCPLEYHITDLPQKTSSTSGRPVYLFPVSVRYTKSAGKTYYHYHDQLRESGMIE